MLFLVPIVLALLLTGLFAFLNERYGILSSDRFDPPSKRFVAYGWLLLLLGVVITLVTAGASKAPSSVDMSSMSFWSLFNFHLILLIFLAGWWLLSGRRPLRQFMNIPREKIIEGTMLGIGIGVAGWAVTLLLMMALALTLNAAGLIPQNLKPSPMIPWMAALPLWKKAVIVFSAMTVEEFFFRGFLQKRVGLIASTILFALAHAGYGQPLMLVGITIVSIIIGYTFYRTRNLIPCIVAHGVFDAIQLFVILPFALQFMEK